MTRLNNKGFRLEGLMLQVGNVTAKMEGFGCSDDCKMLTRLDVGDFTNFNGTE